MPLKLMYITNDPTVAQIAQHNGVDIIFIDLETIGKQERQHNIDSVKSHHSISDIAKIRNVLTSSELLVRTNPIHKNTRDEIDSVIDAGADIVMLPMWKSLKEVNTFVEQVNKRCRTMLLLETREAETVIHNTVIEGVDAIHIGLNDLHLSYKLNFMFELLGNGVVERICKKIESYNIPFGFGGVAQLGKGSLPAELILSEHYRLHSSYVILSRSFCNTSLIQDYDTIDKIFEKGVSEIREYEHLLDSADSEYLIDNHEKLIRILSQLSVKNTTV